MPRRTDRASTARKGRVAHARPQRATSRTSKRGGTAQQPRDLEDLYAEQLRDLHSAENQILQALPRMIRAAQHPNLRRALEEHLRQTEDHVARLQRLFEELGQSPRGKRCKGIEGLLQEGAEVLTYRDPSVRDAALIAAAQRVEHYEIAGYGCVRSYAEQLGLNHHASVLQQTLDEESEADRRLTEIAEEVVNPKATPDMQ